MAGNGKGILGISFAVFLLLVVLKTSKSHQP